MKPTTHNRFRPIAAWVLPLLALAFFLACRALPTIEASLDLSQQRRTYANRLCETTLGREDAINLHSAFAGLWLDRDTGTANRRLREEFHNLFDGVRASPESIDSKRVKWQIRTWLRIYYLFSEGSDFHTGRLEQDTQRLLEEMFWAFACTKSRLARARHEFVWCIQGSENHDMMDLGNSFLATQAIKDVPRYSDRVLPDGHTLSQHAAAWTDYYKHYCDERAKHGLFVEINSPTYGKYFIPELVNIADFSEDKILRRKMRMLLDVVWADWAIDQLNGIRGGGKTRSYQNHYSFRGASDSWYMMGRVLFDIGDWWDGREISNHAIHGFPFILATSDYEVPGILRDLAKGRGEAYTYVSMRPATLVDEPLQSPVVAGMYQMDGPHPSLLRYDYCTPDYIMGSLWIDPREKAYAAISGQNRWQGIIFPTELNARVFPQCVGLRNGKTYDQHQAVQHENVMAVQKSRSARQSGDMRVFFSNGMRGRLVERDGWLLLQEGKAYLAAKGFSTRGGAKEAASRWDDDNWLRFDDDFAPLVFVTGVKGDFVDLDAFEAYLNNCQGRVEREAFFFSFEDLGGKPVRLGLHLLSRELPTVDGLSVDLCPPRVFDSPYLISDHGSGVITIRCSGQSHTLDFNE